MSRARAAYVALAVGALASGPAARDAYAKRTRPDPCASDGPKPGPGSLDPFRPPAPKALELNAAALVPYRAGKWDEARAQYRAALAADPEFLAPRLNIASSFVRQDRFAEATAEAVALLDLAYVPWAREILEAADLGALKTRPEMKELERAMAASAAKWGEGLADSALFVARQRPPLHIPDGPGVFILNPHQEVWAFTPRTQRYRQLTAEDGHVVALAIGFDGRISYVTALKLIRGSDPNDVALRGVTIHELALESMAPLASAAVPGDVRRLEIGEAGQPRGGRLRNRFVYDLEGDATKGLFELTPPGALRSLPSGFGRARLVTLTGRGPSVTVPARTGIWPETNCVASAAPPEGSTPPKLAVYRNGHPPLILKTREGAGSVGLLIP
jgi:hypothetical protein